MSSYRASRQREFHEAPGTRKRVRGFVLPWPAGSRSSELCCGAAPRHVRRSHHRPALPLRPPPSLPLPLQALRVAELPWRRACAAAPALCTEHLPALPLRSSLGRSSCSPALPLRLGGASRPCGAGLAAATGSKSLQEACQRYAKECHDSTIACGCSVTSSAESGIFVASDPHPAGAREGRAAKACHDPARVCQRNAMMRQSAAKPFSSRATEVPDSASEMPRSAGELPNPSRAAAEVPRKCQGLPRSDHEVAEKCQTFFGLRHDPDDECHDPARVCRGNATICQKAAELRGTA